MSAKRVLKWVVLTTLVLTAGAASLIYVAFYVRAPKMRPAPELRAMTATPAVARGEYLVKNVAACFSCHSDVRDDVPGIPPQGTELGGGREMPAGYRLPGHVRAPNLTPDRETGLGAWTDGEVARALREGVSRDGRALFRYMPWREYANVLSDEDTLAIIAYLRSLPAVKHDLPKTALNFPLSLYVRTEPEPLASSPPALPSEPVARGNALLTLARCTFCHAQIDEDHEIIPGRELAGGTRLHTPAGDLYAPNVTSDVETGIGGYTDGELRAAIGGGASKRSHRLIYAMPWSNYAGMTADDTNAIIAALRATKPVKNPVPMSDVRDAKRLALCGR